MISKEHMRYIFPILLYLLSAPRSNAADSTSSPGKLIVHTFEQKTDPETGIMRTFEVGKPKVIQMSGKKESVFLAENSLKINADGLFKGFTITKLLKHSENYDTGNKLLQEIKDRLERGETVEINLESAHYFGYALTPSYDLVTAKFHDGLSANNALAEASRVFPSSKFSSLCLRLFGSSLN